MDIYKIIAFLDAIFWPILALRQFKGKWGWFFVILGITLPAAYLNRWIFDITLDRVAPTFSLLIICSLFPSFFNKYKFILIPFSLLLIYPATFLEHKLLSLFNAADSIIIFIYFMRNLILTLFNESKFNLFFFAISLYAVSVTIRGVLIIALQWEAVDLYYLTSLFQILLMGGFLFIRHDDERLSIPITRSKKRGI